MAAAAGQHAPLDRDGDRATSRALPRGQVWARDGWHFFSRLLRKVLGHTLFAGLCQQRELLPLRTAELLTD